MEQFFADYFQQLQNLHQEFIAAFDGLPVEALDWAVGQDINSICVLVVHTTGATRFWVGDVAMGESSNRNRGAEFEARGLSVAELAARFAVVEEYVRGALQRLTLADLATIQPVPGRNQESSIGAALLHALEHTGLHVGHAQLMRQLWQQR